MDIVVTGLQSWDSDIGSNCIDISKILACSHRVLYVNYPLDRFTVFRYKKHPKIYNRLQIYKGVLPDLEKISDNLWVLTPRTILHSIGRIFNRWLFDFFNRQNNIHYANKIKEAISKLGFSNYIIIDDNDIYRAFYLKELLKPKYFIYYSRDYMSGTKYYCMQGKRLEPALIAKSDLVFTNSIFLEKYARQFNENSFFIGQGCDLDLYNYSDNQLVPEDINNIPYPVIGYVGAINSTRLDLHLLEQLAIVKKEWSFVFIGSEDANFVKSELHKLPNVYFLGKRDQKLLPSYIKAFDVAINIQIINEITIGNYPRKIDEYLAMGKPVVATKTEAMEMFKEYVYLASGIDEYIFQIEIALSDHSSQLKENRIQYARSHSWDNVVNMMIEKIENIE